MLFVKASVREKNGKRISLGLIVSLLDLFFRISHFPGFCGKQKNNRQGQSWLVITAQPFEGNDLKPVQADSLSQGRHIHLITAMSLVVRYKH